VPLPSEANTPWQHEYACGTTQQAADAPGCSGADADLTPQYRSQRALVHEFMRQRKCLLAVCQRDVKFVFFICCLCAVQQLRYLQPEHCHVGCQRHASVTCVIQHSITTAMYRCPRAHTTGAQWWQSSERARPSKNLTTNHIDMHYKTAPAESSPFAGLWQCYSRPFRIPPEDAPQLVTPWTLLTHAGRLTRLPPDQPRTPEPAPRPLVASGAHVPPGRTTAYAHCHTRVPGLLHHVPATALAWLVLRCDAAGEHAQM
jgi:hypothetical protein